MPPAMSTCAMIQPPKMSPCWFTSAGIGTTRSTGGRSGSSTVAAAFRSVTADSRCGASTRYPAESSRLGRLARRLGPRLVPKLATQDLADVGLRQLGAELDLARHLVAGQVLAAMADQRLRGEAFVLLDDEQLHRFARLVVGNADRRALEHAGVHR